MNQDNLSELVVLAQSGNTDALEQLMLRAHTPVSFLCRKLLLNARAAGEQTREVLKIVATKLNTLQDPEQFESWILRITCARCVQILPQLRWGVTADADTAPESLPDIAGQELDAQQTIDAVARMVDTLPEDPRVCILLYCCGGLHSKSISQVASYSVDAVHTNLAKAQSLLQEQLESFMDQGTQFAGITSLAEILKNAMYHSDEDPIPMVYGILGKEIPVPPDPEKQLIRILSVILAILLVAVLIVCGILVLRLTSRTSPDVPLPVSAATQSAVTETTLLPETASESIVEPT